MLIGFDGSRAFVKNKTGTENYSYQLLLHLAKIDKSNHYIVYLRPGVVIKASDWPENFRFVPIEFPRLWTQVGLATQTFKDPLDLLFVPAHTVPLIYKPGLKTVMTIHDLGSEYLPQTHQIKQQLYLKLISKVQIKSCTKLIAVSKATKEDLVQRLGINERKIKVIYEGINEELTNSDAKVDILKYIDIEKGKYFLFVGTIQPRKNLERLIKAFAHLISTHSELKSYKLVLAGGKGWMTEEIYQLPKKLGLEKNIIFTGRISDEELSVLYRNALAFVYPSLFEGFGLPILEAFKFGCPVITSNISSMPEVAGDGALLIDPYQVEEISLSMHTLVKSSDLRTKLVLAGQKQLAKFSWEKCARQTLDLFEEVANG